MLKDSERVKCQGCYTYFFANEKNKFVCPKCKVIYIRKSKKINLESIILSGMPIEEA